MSLHARLNLRSSGDVLDWRITIVAPIAGNVRLKACQVGAGPWGNRRNAARERYGSGILRPALLVLALAVFVAGCGGPPPARCEIDDLDDHMVSTRAVFLERLKGCPIGGRH
jgi:hypothetical protein